MYTLYSILNSTSLSRLACDLSKYKYVYFTEGDQILRSRVLHDMYTYLDSNKYSVGDSRLQQGCDEARLDYIRYLVTSSNNLCGQLYTYTPSYVDVLYCKYVPFYATNYTAHVCVCFCFCFVIYTCRSSLPTEYQCKALR